MEGKLDTPILYIVFNRIDTVKRTFPRIAEQKPKQLFIAADGPRINKDGEAEKCKEVRDYVMSHIDWDCDVKTLFREKNLGCGENVHLAITWFFDNVEQGIVLEDDCLPDPTFFNYCETLLNYYKDDYRVMHITGDNQMIECKNYPYSYYFARLQHCWGWASWKRAWAKYEYVVSDVEKTMDENPYFKNKKLRNWYGYIFLQFEKKPFKIDTWDYQWSYAIFKAQGICINPTRNLITNIGFDGESTHFNNSGHELSRPSFPMEKIIHPPKVEYTEKILKKLDSDVFHITNPRPIKEMKEFIIRIIKWILKKVGLFEKVKKWYNNQRID